MSRVTDEYGFAFLDTLCENLTGKFGESMKAANERRKARIAEVGYEQYRAEYDAESKRRINEANRKAQAEQYQLLLDKAGTVELADKERKMLLACDDDKIRAAYIKILLESSGLGKKFFSWTFNNFPVTKANEAAYEACYDLASGKREKGVVLSTSTNGTGKTRLAAAVINWLAAQGRRVYFTNIVNIKNDILNSMHDNNGGTSKVFDKMQGCELLAIDDLGAETSKTESNFVREFLYRIVNDAYSNGTKLLLTTNLNDRDFAERYGNRTTSRLVEMTDWIEYSDDDHRLFEPIDDGEPTPFDENF